MLPNFLFVGAMKCGTTSIASYLASHPQIFMTKVKEPMFFSVDKQWARGTAWYKDLFKGAIGHPIRGEASTTYTMYPIYPEVILRMRRVLALDEIRFCYCVRNPIDRLISHYLHKWYKGEVTDNLENTINQHSELVDVGLYARQIGQFLPYTHKEQWKVVVFEDYQKETVAVMQSIYHFLGVDNDFVPTQTRPKNVTAEKVRPPRFAESLRSIPGFKPVAKALLPVPSVRRKLKRIGGRRRDVPNISQSTRKHLKGVFRSDVRALSEFLDRDLETLWGMR